MSEKQFITQIDLGRYDEIIDGETPRVGSEVAKRAIHIGFLNLDLEDATKAMSLGVKASIFSRRLYINPKDPLCAIVQQIHKDYPLVKYAIISHLFMVGMEAIMGKMSADTKTNIASKEQPVQVPEKVHQNDSVAQGLKTMNLLDE